MRRAICVDIPTVDRVIFWLETSIHTTLYGLGLCVFFMYSNMKYVVPQGLILTEPRDKLIYLETVTRTIFNTVAARVIDGKYNVVPS